MAITLLFFPTSEDLAEYVIQEIQEAKKTLLSHMQRLNDARRRFDNGSNNTNPTRGDGKKKTKKWTGSDLPGNAERREIEGFKILVNATPYYELSILDEAIKSVQERLEAFEKVEKRLLQDLKNHAKTTMICEDGLPIAFMYNEEERREDKS